MLPVRLGAGFVPPALLCAILAGLFAFDRSGHVGGDVTFVRPFVAALRAEGLRIVRVRRATHYEAPGTIAASIYTRGSVITVISTSEPAAMTSALQACSDCMVTLDGTWVVVTDTKLDRVVKRILVHSE